MSRTGSRPRPASDSEPEVAWWESYRDPVLSDLIRRAARENRDVKIAAERLRAARAGETISRSWLFPSVGVGGAAFDHKTNYDSILKNVVPEAANTRAAQIGVGVTWEVDLFGRLRAGAAAAAADTLAVENGARGVRLLVLTDVATNYFTLVGALRQLETRACDIGRARRNAAPRNGAPTGRSRDAVRRRTCADGSLEGARGDTAARNARRRLAASHRGAHWRPGVQCREHHAVDRRANRSAGASGSTGRAVAAEAGPARCERAARRRQRAPATGDGGVVPAASSRRRVRAREHRSQRRGPWRGALHQRRGAAGDADLQRRTHAGDQRHRRERTTRSRPALRRRDRACTGGRREHARRARRRTAPGTTDAERGGLGRRGAWPRAIALRPRADRFLAVARRSARPAGRAGLRK